MSNYCPNCGAKITTGKSFCGECGKKILQGKVEAKAHIKDIKPRSTTSIILEKKKNRGCFKTVGLVLLGFLAVIIIGLIILYNLGDTKDSSELKVDNEFKVNQDNEVDSSYETDIETSSYLNEPKNLKKATAKMENIFKEADTTQLKLLLTDTSFKTYKDVYAEIEPYMDEYAKAFKNRELIKLNEIFALYSFEDEEGNKFTTEFTSTNSGNWKLVRF